MSLLFKVSLGGLQWGQKGQGVLAGKTESQLCKRLTSLLPNPPLRFPLGKEAPAWGRGVVTGPPGPVSEKQAFSR